MLKSKFFSELKELLEEDNDLNENSPITLSSLANLAIIAYVDENFEKQVKTSELKAITKVQDLMRMIGIENFE